jgi:hypothetical protein
VGLCLGGENNSKITKTSSTSRQSEFVNRVTGLSSSPTTSSFILSIVSVYAEFPK